MKRVVKPLGRNMGVMLIAVAILGLALGTSSGNVFAQQNMTNMTSSTPITTDGRMGHGSGGGEGMSGMGGMTGGGGQHGAGGMMMEGSGMEQKPGMMSEMCSMSEGMPPHYCEPSYHVMSSAKGIRINDVFPVNDKQLGLEIQNINRNANATNQDIVIVGGGGGSLAGASVIQGGWSNSTEGFLNLDGTGSIYDINSVHLHLFPLTE